MHVRTQIRHAIAARVTGLSTTGIHVFTALSTAIARNALPAILVQTQNELLAPVTLPAPRRQDRRTRYRVTAVARIDDTLEDVLDQICLEAEVALAMPGNTIPAKTLTLVSTEISISNDDSKPVGLAVMVYEAAYMTAENAPDTVR